MSVKKSEYNSSWRLATVQQCHGLLQYISKIMSMMSSFICPITNSHALSFCPPAVIEQWLEIGSSLEGQSLPGVCWQSGMVLN